ncbi:MAG TPA: DUF3500 domain-containing protein [Vicinamibacterales bacterium]|nr:DUF3500 domain-containing protein [Vicinamibacterales bacterium]
MRRLLISTGLLVSAAAIVVASQTAPEQAMARAAGALIATLDEPQRARLLWPFDSDERLNWHFIPRERQGLSLEDMNERQREAAFALLRAGLSQKGYSKAETIRSLEVVLAATGSSLVRDPELYFFTLFGDPSSPTWAWRYEGHHLSQNWTIVSGRATATTPAFFGASPAEVRAGPMAGTRALAAEADLAWSLLGTLTPEQRQQAVTATTAPRDIITGAERVVSILDNVGLAADRMTPAQQGTLMSLVEEHASSQSPALAAARMARVRSGGLTAIRFAWMGATTRAAGAGYYYRIQGPAFLIEYDNTQNNANHQHIVWRDFTADFGRDVLGDHYAADPHGLAVLIDR